MPGENDRDEAGCCLDTFLREADGAGLDFRTTKGRADAYQSVVWAMIWRRRWDSIAYKIGNAFLTALALGLLLIAGWGAAFWGGHIKVD
jgi:hypothetical protein